MIKPIPKRLILDHFCPSPRENPRRWTGLQRSDFVSVCNKLAGQRFRELHPSVVSQTATDPRPHRWRGGALVCLAHYMVRGSIFPTTSGACSNEESAPFRNAPPSFRFTGQSQCPSGVAQAVAGSAPPLLRYAFASSQVARPPSSGASSLPSPEPSPAPPGHAPWPS